MSTVQLGHGRGMLLTTEELTLGQPETTPTKFLESQIFSPLLFASCQTYITNFTHQNNDN
jgi:hypothetical protein